MLVERAFVWSVSGRALLAVLAVAFSVAYALLTAGAVSSLEGTGSALERALDEPGFAVHRSDLAPYPSDQAPPGAIRVHVTQFEGVKLASVDPWPLEEAHNVSGARVPTTVPASLTLSDGDWRDGDVPFAPRDAYVVPPEWFAALVPGGLDSTAVSFVPGAVPPSTHLETTPWRGVGIFYEAGAAQLTAGLVAFVLATGVVAALLSSGFVRLEVLARRSDLATLAALAGPRAVRRVVVWRGLVVVSVGIVIGVVGAFAILRILQSAMGAPLSVRPLFIVLAIGAAGGGSAVLATWSGLTALRGMDLARGSGGTSVRRFKGPIRYVFVTPRLFTGVAAAALVATGILSVVMAASSVPDALFGSSEGQETLISGSGNPLRGHSDAFVGQAARLVEGVRHSMPETFAPTTLDGRPLMVKGTDMESWRDFESPRIVAGRLPSAAAEATVGLRAMDAHDLRLGQTIVVPASYHVGIERLRLVGVHETGGLADDEVWTDLDTAGRLAGLAAGQSTLVRLVMEPEAPGWADLAPGPGIQVLRVALSPDPPAPWSPAEVVIDVANFDPVPRVRDLTARVNGDMVAALTVRLDGHEIRTLRLPTVMPAGSSFVLEVNPTREYGARPGGLDLVFPEAARPGQPFDVLFQRLQEPAAGVRVSVNGQEVGLTDAEGRLSLTIDEAQLASITGANERHRGGSLLRVAPEAWDDIAQVTVGEAFFGTARSVNDTHGVAEASIVLVNLGGRDFAGPVEWRHRGAVVANETVRLESGERLTMTHSVTLALGTGMLQVAGADVPYRVTVAPRSDGGESTADPNQRPRLSAEEAIALRQESVASAGSGDTTKAFLAQLFVTLDAAVILVVLITVVHSGSVVWVTVLREVRERRELVDLYGQIGASQVQLRMRAMRDATVSAVPAIVVGVTGAYLALRFLSSVGFPAAFGHSIAALPDTGLVARVIAALFVVAGFAASYAVGGSSSERAPQPEDRSIGETMRGMS